eukprot:PLAT6864.2.p1 GENE.PLAT6864.2~~PLAT6864.2.p1  ORF type:complete len:1056 (+),score=499.15 PLAT6864.2:41-3169(+)
MSGMGWRKLGKRVGIVRSKTSTGEPGDISAEFISLKTNLKRTREGLQSVLTDVNAMQVAGQAYIACLKRLHASVMGFSRESGVASLVGDPFLKLFSETETFLIETLDSLLNANAKMISDPMERLLEEIEIAREYKLKTYKAQTERARLAERVSALSTTKKVDVAQKKFLQAQHAHQASNHQYKVLEKETINRMTDVKQSTRFSVTNSLVWILQTYDSHMSNSHIALEAVRGKVSEYREEVDRKRDAFEGRKKARDMEAASKRRLHEAEQGTMTPEHFETLVSSMRAPAEPVRYTGEGLLCKAERVISMGLGQITPGIVYVTNYRLMFVPYQADGAVAGDGGLAAAAGVAGGGGGGAAAAAGGAAGGMPGARRSYEEHKAAPPMPARPGGRMPPAGRGTRMGGPPRFAPAAAGGPPRFSPAAAAGRGGAPPLPARVPPRGRGGFPMGGRSPAAGGAGGGAPRPAWMAAAAGVRHSGGSSSSAAGGAGAAGMRPPSFVPPRRGVPPSPPSGGAAGGAVPPMGGAGVGAAASRSHGRRTSVDNCSVPDCALSKTRGVFCMAHDETSEGVSVGFTVPLMSITKMEAYEDKDLLALWCKDLTAHTLSFRYSSSRLPTLMSNFSPFVWSIENIFAFYYRLSTAVSPSEDGWNIYEPREEFRRVGVPNSTWRLTEVNKRYGLAPSYPALLAVPARMSDDEVIEGARFRSKQRLPALCWHWPWGDSSVGIVRCSQPLVGLSRARSEYDERLLSLVADTSRTRGLYITDARPQLNALGNVAKGGGWEDVEAYVDSKIVFMGIENIHAVRNSFVKLHGSLCKDITMAAARSLDSWVSHIEPQLQREDDDTKWFYNMSTCLAGAVRVAQMIDEERTSVVVHCSDGWDRTSQLTSLAQLMLDPYYRTMVGFEVLVEKEWLSFGHKFARRCGHGPERSKNDDSQRSPIFVQWLDCVHQMLVQYPTAFQFNSFFLETILHHVYSCRFGTFLCDNERERYERKLKAKTVSLWSDLNRHTEVFLNKSYETLERTLYPLSDVSRLKLWKFYWRQWVKTG